MSEYNWFIRICSFLFSGIPNLKNIIQVLINFINTNVWMIEYVILYAKMSEKKFFSFENSFLKF